MKDIPFLLNNVFPPDNRVPTFIQRLLDATRYDLGAVVTALPVPSSDRRPNGIGIATGNPVIYIYCALDVGSCNYVQNFEPVSLWRGAPPKIEYLTATLLLMGLRIRKTTRNGRRKLERRDSVTSLSILDSWSQSCPNAVLMIATITKTLLMEVHARVVVIPKIYNK
jgi:hypothetical protein